MGENYLNYLAASTVEERKYYAEKCGYAKVSDVK